MSSRTFTIRDAKSFGYDHHGRPCVYLFIKYNWLARLVGINDTQIRYVMLNSGWNREVMGSPNATVETDQGIIVKLFEAWTYYNRANQDPVRRPQFEYAYSASVDDMYLHMRKTNHSIPDEHLDRMVRVLRDAIDARSEATLVQSDGRFDNFNKHGLGPGQQKNGQKLNIDEGSK